MSAKSSNKVTEYHEREAEAADGTVRCAEKKAKASEGGTRYDEPTPHTEWLDVTRDRLPTAR